MLLVLITHTAADVMCSHVFVFNNFMALLICRAHYSAAGSKLLRDNERNQVRRSLPRYIYRPVSGKTKVINTVIKLRRMVIYRYL